MGITSSPATGIVIGSPAANGTINSDQTGLSANQIRLTNTLSTTNNGQIETTPSYVGRLIRIRRGVTGDEERYVTAESGTGPVVLTVHEDWITTPVGGTDTYDVAYNERDLYDGAFWSLLSKRVNDYTSSRRTVVGDGTNYAWVSLCDGPGYETVDNSSTTIGDIIVRNAAQLTWGYQYGGVPVSGGYVNGTPAVDGELVLDLQSGGRLDLYDFFMTCVKQNKVLLKGTVRAKKAKFYSASYTMDLTGSVTLEESIIEGKGTTNDTLQCDATTDIQSLVLINTYGLLTANDTTTETIECRNVTFIGNARLLLVYQNRTWKFVNPVWDVDTTTQTDIDFNTATGTSVQELFSLDTSVADPAGTAIQDARVKVSEHLLNDDIAHSGSTDANGLFAVDILKRTFTDNTTSLTVALKGDFSLKVYKWAKTPYIAALTVADPIDVGVTLVDDPYTVAATAAAALTAGSGIAVSRHATGETDTRPLKVLHFDGGTGTIPSTGATLTGAGGASGTVVESIGTAATGYIVVELWNGTDYVNNEVISVTSPAFSASADLTGDTLSFYEEYTWEVDCNSLSLQTVYDYLGASMEAASPATWANAVVIWGEDEQTQLMYGSANGFVTARNIALTEGVWLSHRGSGTLAYLTADDGTTWVPPVAYEFTLTGLKTGTEVRLIKDADGLEVPGSGVESSGTSYTFQYTYSADIAVDVVVFHVDYIDIRLVDVILSNANQTIPVQQQTDRVHWNP